MKSETTHSPETLKLMRAWIGDCTWGDLDPEELEELSDAQVVRGVARHYAGGLEQFLRDMVPVPVEAA